ncbi:Putative uncharacterized protein [Moritella viscosa]|uniref:hypothetical protein n=1 Tax=Moritella viscosa TaxID=80854 RepID=UPI000508E47C|nr:hypothetical protein [Moritella viscosa]CED61477.1 putative uncharacterized protein [Moritella viscosa]SHO05485.1 Putative uncharacterized protein [Moritella viscosa]SHO21436.1 Putative uncharacterized protein [Moritella viscosa]
MEYFWWEKTVEYVFVQKHVEIEMAIAPLGGVQEKGGDAILENNDRWVLIEFKKAHDCISSEVDKFAPGKYDEAKVELQDRSQHHFLVYGVLNGEKLDLTGQLYFGTSEVKVEYLLNEGTDEETFLSYYHDFIGYKKSKEGSSGGGVTCVVGINSLGKASKVMSAHEYEDTLILKNKLNAELAARIRQRNTPTRTTGMGM